MTVTAGLNADDRVLTATTPHGAVAPQERSVALDASSGTVTG